MAGSCFSFKGGGQKLRKHNFEIAVDPKGPPSELTFWSVWRHKTIRGARVGHTHFPAKSGPKNQNWKISIITWISHRQSIDNSLQIFPGKFWNLAAKFFARPKSKIQIVREGRNLVLHWIWKFYEKKLKNSKIFTHLVKRTDAKSRTEIWPIFSIFRGFLAINEAI